MFALVKFCSKEFYITEKNKIKHLNNDNYLVKYKGGATYAATLLRTHANKKYLEQVIKQFAQDDKEDTKMQPNVTKGKIISQKLRSGEILTKKRLHTVSQDPNEAISQTDIITVQDLQPRIAEIILLNTNNIDEGEGNTFVDEKSISNQPNEATSTTDTITEVRHEDTIGSEEPNETCTVPNETNETDTNIEVRCYDTTGSDPDFTADTNETDATIMTTQNISCESTNISYSGPTLDIRNLVVPESMSSDNKRKIKKDFCLYCKKLVTQFARHLKTHRTETDVQLLMKYPEKSLPRMQLIKQIRRNGNFIHNTQPAYNSGIVINCRQKQLKSHNTAEDYIVCTKCRGSFSKRSIRIHYKKCNLNHKKGVREIINNGRQMARYVHSRASKELKTLISKMHDDKITRSIKYDELIIMAGNRLCEKYILSHQDEMIRSHLRLLGRLKLAVVAKTENINELSSIFHPKYYDVVVDAVKTVAQYNSATGSYKSPSNATRLGTSIKKCSVILIAECIKKEDDEKKKAIENFMILFEEDYAVAINKKVAEEQINRKREKTVVLPTEEDIRKLYIYVKQICGNATESLKNGFDYSAWKNLSEACLILLQMFNRRRSGEIERFLIADYERRESGYKNMQPKLFEQLPAKARQRVKGYVRVTIRGKLNRTVPVLLDSSLVKWIELILQYRLEAGVDPDNKYVFGVPSLSKRSKKYLRACPLMRNFSKDCGAVIPESLRGTTLRKHIATYTAMLGINENEVQDLANFMGHHKDVHKEVYRVPAPYKDVTVISELLETAMGVNKGESDCDSEDENNAMENNMPNQGNNSIKSTNSADSISPRLIKRRSTSPYGKTKRQRWTDEERGAVENRFGNLTEIDILPSLEECSQLIKDCPILHRRKPQTLKTFIDNQRKAEQRKSCKFV